jgi:hypothetical protein
MELHFPQGSLDKSMSDEMQDQFFEKLKPAVWCILTKINTDQLTATAFCVDPEKMLLLTAAHTFEESWKGDVDVPMEKIEVFARRDLDQDNIMVHCKIVCMWKYVDLALLQVVDEEKKEFDLKDLDYVSFDRDFISSRQLSVGMELFSIGVPGSKGFLILRGLLSYEFSEDFINYSVIGNDVNFLRDYNYQANSDFITSMEGNRRVPRNSEATNFYNNNRDGIIIEDSFINDGQMNPKVKLLQTDFGGVQLITGLSGSPIFNGKGKVVGMVVSSRYGCIYELSASALDDMLTYYKAEREEDEPKM